MGQAERFAGLFSAVGRRSSSGAHWFEFAPKESIP
jgi:hypothetical protein